MDILWHGCQNENGISFSKPLDFFAKANIIGGMTDLATAVLHKEVQSFLKRTGMGPTYFGQLAAGNTRLVERLQSGRTVTLQTAERIRKFIASQIDSSP